MKRTLIHLAVLAAAAQPRQQRSQHLHSDGLPLANRMGVPTRTERTNPPHYASISYSMRTSGREST